jgi:iron complex transport system substrate-binding protein
VYGKAGVEFPQRIVCLTAETAEVAFLLGAGDRVVGVPGTARRPDAVRERARVGGFTTFRTDRILALQPDLVLAFSDLQRDVVAELIGAGVGVLCTNQRSFDDVLRAILLIGGALGREAAARALVADMRDEGTQIREYSSGWPDRPRVFFEEWMDPLIAGIAWVSDLVEIAGEDILAPGPSLMHGLRRIHEIVHGFQTG